MKKLLLYLIVLFNVLPVFAQTLSGGVYYDADSARTEAFSNVESSFSSDLIAEHITDADYDSNMNALLNGQAELKDHTICRFSTGIYGIRYKSDPYRAYYYTPSGKLDYVDKKSSLDYPHKVMTYDLNGKLIGSALYVSKEEQFIFDVNKKLTTHWIGNNGYDKNGVKKWSRVYVE